MEYTISDEDERASFTFDDFNDALASDDDEVMEEGMDDDYLSEDDSDAEADGLESVRTDRLDGQAWLIRIPADLAERLETMERSGVKVGTLGITYKNASQTEIQGMTIELDASNPAFAMIPPKYAVELLDQAVTNTFCFSEPRALPSISELQAAASMAATQAGQPPPKLEADKPPPLSMSDAAAMGVGIGRGSAFRARIVHRCTARPMELDTNPVMLKNALRLSQRKSEKRGGPRIIQIADVAQESYLNPVKRSEKAIMNEFNFKKQRPVRAEDRMHRMDRVKLEEVLFHCFTQYQYWTMKALVERTQQPRAYLHEVLTEIAALETSGQYHGTYRLREEYRARGVEDGRVFAGEEEGVRRVLKDDTEVVHDDMEEDDEELAHLGVYGQ